MVAAEGRGGRGMGGEDNGQNLEALAQRIEALDQRLAVLDRENRVLREAVRSGAVSRQLEMSQQQPPQAKEMAVASSKTANNIHEPAVAVPSALAKALTITPKYMASAMMGPTYLLERSPNGEDEPAKLSVPCLSTPKPKVWASMTIV